MEIENTGSIMYMNTEALTGGSPGNMATKSYYTSTIEDHPISHEEMLINSLRRTIEEQNLMISRLRLDMEVLKNDMHLLQPLLQREIELVKAREFLNEKI